MSDPGAVQLEQVHHSVPLPRPVSVEGFLAPGGWYVNAEWAMGRTAGYLYKFGAVSAPPADVPHWARLQVVDGEQCWVWTLAVFPPMPDLVADSS